jgi:hypothetical protein
MPEKKLIIDEDWKSQVQAEKEAAAKEQPKSPVGEPGSEGEVSTGPQEGTAPTPTDIQMPPASLEMLVTTLATEALVALGQVPHPVTGERQTLRNQAQYLIDTVEVLREKTKGNLTSDEQHMIDSVLHQLRMVFLETADTQQSKPT